MLYLKRIHSKIGKGKGLGRFDTVTLADTTDFEGFLAGRRIGTCHFTSGEQEVCSIHTNTRARLTIHAALAIACDKSCFARVRLNSLVTCIFGKVAAVRAGEP